MRLVDKLSRYSLLTGALLGLMVSVYIVGFRHIGYFETLELMAYDWLIKTVNSTARADSRIVFIEVSERDIQQLGQYPLSDEILARALAALMPSRPRVVGLDIYRDIPVPPGREYLDRVLAGHANIVVVMKFEAKGSVRIPPPKVLEGTQQVGFADMIVDPGGLVRRGVLFLDDGVNVYYSLALQLALQFLHGENIVPQPDPDHPDWIRLGTTTIRPFGPDDGGYVDADARGYQFLLDFKGAANPFKTYSLSALLDGHVPPGDIRDKVVVIGVSAESVKDFFYTPISLGQDDNPQMAGTALHAHIVSQLLRYAIEGESTIQTPSNRLEILWILLWGMLGGMLHIRIRSAWLLGLSALGGLAVLGAAVMGLFFAGWWLPWVPPAFAWLISAAIITAFMLSLEKHQRSTLMQLFCRHVSPSVAQEIWKERDQFMAGGRPRSQKLIASVLFSDLVGFTSVSENLEPEPLLDWLNTYMASMARHVDACGGVIDKYIGDAVMAVFGIPLARMTEEEIGRDAVNAVNCALQMAEKLSELNRAWQKENKPVIGMRIGIFTGPLVAGSLGSAQRLEYTVIGDTVNVASRLESYDKENFVPDAAKHPCRVLIGEATLGYLNGSFNTVRIGEARLKGKHEKIAVFEVMGKRTSAITNKNRSEVKSC